MIFSNGEIGMGNELPILRCYGPGYRVYDRRHGRKLIVLLAGGDKSTQAKDIKTALRLARNL
jgi:putative addiction module killer protein